MAIFCTSACSSAGADLTNAGGRGASFRPGELEVKDNRSAQVAGTTPTATLNFDAPPPRTTPFTGLMSWKSRPQPIVM